jgi:hypothetical protein
VFKNVFFHKNKPFLKENNSSDRAVKQAKFGFRTVQAWFVMALQLRISAPVPTLQALA